MCWLNFSALIEDGAATERVEYYFENKKKALEQVINKSPVDPKVFNGYGLHCWDNGTPKSYPIIQLRYNTTKY